MPSSISSWPNAISPATRQSLLPCQAEDGNAGGCALQRDLLHRLAVSLEGVAGCTWAGGHLAGVPTRAVQESHSFQAAGLSVAETGACGLTGRSSSPACET